MAKAKFRISKATKRKIRRIYTYLGSGVLGTMFALYNIPAITQNRIFFWFGVGAFIVQLWNDRDKEPLKDLEPDPL